MRELSLIETGYLAGLLLLSLVLPLRVSWRGPRGASARRSGLKLVWAGQILIALCAVVVLAAASLAPYAAGFGLISCAGVAMELFRGSRHPPAA